jgi:hypothetical protein
MDEYVKVELEVTREAAEALRDESRRRRAGKLLSNLLRPASERDDPLIALLEEIQRDAAVHGLTPQEVDAELAAYNAERRDRR